MDKSIQRLFILFLLMAMISACVPPTPTAPTQAAQPTKPNGGSTMPTPAPTEPAAADAILAARRTLAVKLSLDPSALVLVSAEQVDWPDSCLGAAGRDELCLTVITPGYRVQFQTGGKLYQANTNLSGSLVRLPEKNPVRIP